ncbi:MAG TPA: AraC family transcriptional regulator [Candidatus Ventrimonas merdavium]|nr:AraC family transcriptional regulator [Candidatus Ventrimonas merdavium]
MKNYLFLNNEYFDITIYQYGYEQCVPNHTFGPGMRNHYLIHCILSGNGTYRTNDREREQEYHLHAGQAFLIEPNRLVHYFADGSTPWEYIWIEFDGMKAKEYLSEAGLSQAAPVYRASTEEGFQELSENLLYLINNPDILPAEVIGHTYLFFGSLIRNSRNSRRLPKNNIQDFYVQSTVDFIENHYMEEISVEDMAQNLGLNRSYFSKVFKKATQKSPQDFLIQYRINKACELLRSTRMSVGQTAQLVGYHNPFHFTRAFKKLTNQSPQEWRKRNGTQDAG